MKRKAFTLVELLVVVLIIGVLTTVSSFYYKRYSLNAKRVEALTNLGHIRQLEEVYRAEENMYVSCDWSPVDIPPPQGTESWNSNSYFYKIGFHPVGILRYRYSVAKSTGSYTSSQCIADVERCYNDSVVENGYVVPRDNLIDILGKAEADLDNDGKIGKLFIPDEPPRRVVYVNYSVF